MYAFLRLLLVHDDYNSTDNGKMNSLLPMLNRTFCPIKPEKTSAFGMMSSSRLLSVYQNPFP